jgi:hypothetical protein
MKIKLQLIFLCFFAFSSNAFAQQEAKKFDEMGQLPCDAAKARLDNFAIQLQSDPTATGYLIFYGGKTYHHLVYDKKTKQYVGVQLLPRHGEAKARIDQWISYLTDSRGIDRWRLEVIDGGYREEPTIEYWVAPSGAKPPTPTPTLTEKEIKFRKGRLKGREIRCEV